jgi:hypothetical protein
MASHIVIFALAISLSNLRKMVRSVSWRCGELLCSQCSAPTNLQRSDTNALTAEDLDFIQLEKLKDGLASL